MRGWQRIEVGGHHNNTNTRPAGVDQGEKWRLCIGTRLLLGGGGPISEPRPPAASGVSPAGNDTGWCRGKDAQVQVCELRGLVEGDSAGVLGRWRRRGRGIRAYAQCFTRSMIHTTSTRHATVEEKAVGRGEKRELAEDTRVKWPEVPASTFTTDTLTSFRRGNFLSLASQFSSQGPALVAQAHSRRNHLPHSRRHAWEASPGHSSMACGSAPVLHQPRRSST